MPKDSRRTHVQVNSRFLRDQRIFVFFERIGKLSIVEVRFRCAHDYGHLIWKKWKLSVENCQLFLALSNSKYTVTYWRRSPQFRANWRSRRIVGTRYGPIALCPISYIPSNNRVQAWHSLFAIVFATVLLNYSSCTLPVSLFARTCFLLGISHAGDIVLLKR